MKKDEDKLNTQSSQNAQNQEKEITSASVENAHATGDGTVKKSDELLPTEDEGETTTETTPY